MQGGWEDGFFPGLQHFPAAAGCQAVPTGGGAPLLTPAHNIIGYDQHSVHSCGRGCPNLSAEQNRFLGAVYWNKQMLHAQNFVIILFDGYTHDP